MFEMSQNLKRFLTQLSKKIDLSGEVKSGVTIRITDHAYKWYFALSDTTKDALHREMENLGFVRLCYRKKVMLGAFKHIESIHVVDGGVLLDSLGITPRTKLIGDLSAQLENVSFQVSWWEETRDNVIIAWSQSKTFHGIRPAQIELILDAMKLVELISSSSLSASLPDMRTLSVNLYYDSKRLENKTLVNLVYKLMSPHLDPDVAEMIETGEELLEHFGICKYPVPMRFKAKGTLICQGRIDLSALQYGIGVSPDEVLGVEWAQDVPYVLFIENRTSFERYVREVDDDGLVIYTAGFPPSAWMRAINLLVKNLINHVPVYHWGDRDVGGYRILAFLAKWLNADITPYLMGLELELDIEFDEANTTRPVSELILALESARGYPSISVLYDQLVALNQRELIWIEQEKISPRSPVPPS
ncbi:hypothetical protein C942_00689 [Photobacterium marinum]|uniref:Wadjet protein JetD C-terminal domain-containing protein n=1 Tax=Photobacterium marinum TaxID=1056511 RepID=L8J9X3_9GAMM|nr:Wadjet anti-phage system protein JetD domain-containing protein [Photobacterium marinum]ELR65606.1 hypothetical protein C942_00689 [Photobacterium marinum]